MILLVMVSIDMSKFKVGLVKGSSVHKAPAMRQGRAWPHWVYCMYFLKRLSFINLYAKGSLVHKPLAMREEDSDHVGFIVRILFSNVLPFINLYVKESLVHEVPIMHEKKT